MVLFINKVTYSAQIGPGHCGTVFMKPCTEMKLEERKKDKTILLIMPPPQPNWDYSELHKSEVSPPMGLFSIGSFLSNRGYRVKIVDAMVDGQYMGKIRQNLLEDILFVGISAMTAQVPLAVKIAELIKQIRPDVPLVWGGVHPTLFPEQTCEDSLVDVVVVGEGEYTCYDIAEAFCGSKDLSNVKGIFYKNGDKVSFTGARKLEDLNRLPFPDYDLLEMDRYLERIVLGRKTRVFHVHTGMGCPYKCTFCVDPIFYQKSQYQIGKCYRGKTANRILDEIGILIDRFGVEHVRLRDEIFFIDRRRLVEFLNEIENRKYKFTWFTNVRADYFNERYLSDNLVKRMAHLGCIRMAIGAESGSPRILQLLKKGIIPTQVETAAKLANKHGITIGYSFMIALPCEEKEDMLMTFQLINRLKAMGPYLSFYGPNIYRPIPGGTLYEDCLKLGLNHAESLREWAKAEAGLNETGFMELKSLPWIKERQDCIPLIQYILKSTLRPRKELINSFLIAVSQIRSKLDFWYFPVEIYLFKILRFIYYIVRPSRNRV